MYDCKVTSLLRPLATNMPGWHYSCFHLFVFALQECLTKWVISNALLNLASGYTYGDLKVRLYCSRPDNNHKCSTLHSVELDVGWSRWVPPKASREDAYEHLNLMVPDDVK